MTQSSPASTPDRDQSVPTRTDVITDLGRSLLDFVKREPVNEGSLLRLQTLLKDFLEAESPGESRPIPERLVDILQYVLQFGVYSGMDHTPWIVALLRGLPQEWLTGMEASLKLDRLAAFARDSDENLAYDSALLCADRSGIVCVGLMGPTGPLRPSHGDNVRAIDALSRGIGARLREVSG